MCVEKTKTKMLETRKLKNIFALLLVFVSAPALASKTEVVSGESFCATTMLSTDSDMLTLASIPEAIRATISRRGPFGGAIAVRVTDGRPEIYGADYAVRSAKASIMRHRDL